MPKITTYIVIFLFLTAASIASAYQLRVVYLQNGNVQINNPEISQAFYDELKGEPRDYFIDSSKDFELYINLLVPEKANRDGRYSAKIFSEDNGNEQQIAESDGDSSQWQEYYDNFGRDYYLKGPELDNQLAAGKYKIEIFSEDNQGKYVLETGKKEIYDAQSILNIYWQLPFLKLTFFETSVLQFFLTPFGIAGIGAIGVLLIFIALIYYFVGAIREFIKHNQAKTLLLTSSGMQMKNEIVKLLQKPAYDITVAFISTAAKPQENLDYLKSDWNIMRDEMGFNVEEVDIEGKKEAEVMKLLELKDIIFVEGGNAFYLLKAMRECNFEKIIRKLLKQGKVYIGVSAGSMVAGRTIQTAGWKDGDKNIVGLKNLKGLNLVPFDIFVHYQPEYAELIKSKIKNPKKRAKKLKILTDDQAILVQGREVDLIGKGEQIVV
ncbi:MAG: Type 1 glutamine amidotransferase-like domain-containing protein [Candidatus Staskawiczbacteria bacterium]|jgi:peptidase E